MLAYFDCFSGISGDMALGSLIDVGVPLERLRDDLSLLQVSGYTVNAERVERLGISGTRVKIDLDPTAAMPHRHLSDVLDIICGSSLPDSIKERSSAVFRSLAAAEAKIHGVPQERVHFHEVGAIDAIVDIVGVVCGLEALGVNRIYSSALPTGIGSVQTSHGLLPVPAPATLGLLAEAHAPLRPSVIEAELITPTGAALLTTLADFCQPAMRLHAVGYGFGMANLPWANCARIWIGDATESDGADGWKIPAEAHRHGTHHAH
jgi:pyridinium-3,5-bisthiocarboxylic acid mononucleotide nickel chelatase